jgi:hypothetical protein
MSDIYFKLKKKIYIDNINYGVIRRIVLLQCLSESYLSHKPSEFRKGFKTEIREILRQYAVFSFFSDPNNFVGKKEYPFINEEIETLYKLLGYLTCNTLDARKIENKYLTKETIIRNLEANLELSKNYLTEVINKRVNKKNLSLQMNDLYILKTLDMNNSYHRDILIYWETERSTYRSFLQKEQEEKTKRQELIDFMERCLAIET